MNTNPKIEVSEITIAARLKLKQYSSWRSLSPVYRGGDLVGFVGYTNGYRGAWRLYPIRRSALNNSDGIDGHMPDQSAFKHDYPRLTARDDVETIRQVLNGEKFGCKLEFPTVAEKDAERLAADQVRIDNRKRLVRSIERSNGDKGRQIAALERVIRGDVLTAEEMVTIAEVHDAITRDRDHWRKNLDKAKAELAEAEGGR